MCRIRLWKKGAAAAAALLAMIVGPIGNAWSADPSMRATIGIYPGTVVSFLPWIAAERGFYKEEGVEPTLIPVASGPLMTSNVASGSIDFGINPVSNVGLAREKGLDVVFVSGNMKMFWVMMVRSGIPTPNAGKYPDVIRDLKGLNWGSYGRGSDGEIFMRIMAKEAGLDPDRDMTWLGIGGPATGIPAMKAGQLDVYLTVDPAPTVMKADKIGQSVVDMRLGDGPADLKGIEYNGLFGLRKTTVERAPMVAGVGRAHQKAYCWAKDPKNLDALVAMMKEKMPSGGLTEEQFRNMIKDNIPGLSTSFRDESFAKWNDLLIRNKVFAAPVAASDILWKDMPRQEPAC